MTTPKPFSPGQYAVWRRYLKCAAGHPTDIPVRVHRVCRVRAMVEVLGADGVQWVTWAKISELRYEQQA